MRKIIIVLILWLAGFSVSVEAANLGNLTGMKAGGFSFLTLTKQKGVKSEGIKRGHTWFTFSIPWDSLTTLVVFIAPEGPPSLLHDLRVTRRLSRRGLESVTFGKFIPPFAWEFQSLRIDQTEAVYYSRVLDPVYLVARDTGVQLNGSVRAFQWAAAAFAGIRTGGGFSQADQGNPDFYLRLQMPFGSRARIGASQRFGPIPATAVDGFVRCGPLEFNAEGIRIRGEEDFYVLGVIRLPARTSLLYRYEDFQNKSYHTYGGAVRVSDHFLTKLNFVNGPDPFTAIGQLVMQF